MGERSKRHSHKKQSKGILFGIPLLLFMGAIALLSVATWRHVKQAFYLYDFVVKDSYKAVDVREQQANTGAIKFPTLGEVYGSLKIKDAGINCKVVFGDGDKQLLKGAGHFDGSKFPGEGGNVVLAGHRETVFKTLGKAKKNDEIIFDTSYGKYVYKVSEIKIVKANDTAIVGPRNKEQLTLYTCYPFDTVGYTPERYVVIGDLVQGKSIKDTTNGGVN